MSRAGFPGLRSVRRRSWRCHPWHEFTARSPGRHPHSLGRGPAGIPRNRSQTGYDHVVVEAHHPGQDDWTTLPDKNGHTTQDPGGVCEYDYYYDPSSFVQHYLTLPTGPDEVCTSSGTTGEWWAASGASDGYQNWDVDLSGYAGTPVEVSITYISDGGIQRQGVFVDDIVVSTGQGSTSFEDDGDTFDGWTVPGPPVGSGFPENENDWTVGPADRAVPYRHEKR